MSDVTVPFEGGTWISRCHECGEVFSAFSNKDGCEEFLGGCLRRSIEVEWIEDEQVTLGCLCEEADDDE